MCDNEIEGLTGVCKKQVSVKGRHQFVMVVGRVGLKSRTSAVRGGYKGGSGEGRN